MQLKVGSRVVAHTFILPWAEHSLSLPNPLVGVVTQILRPRGGVKRYLLGTGMSSVNSIRYNPTTLSPLDQWSIVKLTFSDVRKHGRLNQSARELYEQLTSSGYSVSLSRIVGLAPNTFRTKPKTRTTKRGPLTLKTSKYILSSHALT